MEMATTAPGRPSRRVAKAATERSIAPGRPSRRAVRAVTEMIAGHAKLHRKVVKMAAVMMVPQLVRLSPKVAKARPETAIVCSKPIPATVVPDAVAQAVMATKAA